MLTCFSGISQAQRNGGGNSNATATLLAFDSITSLNGSTPSCSGDYTITNPIPGYYTWTTFKVSIKAKPINLPDNSVLTVSLYTKDAVTGESLPAVRLGDMAVLSKTAISKSSFAFLDLGLLYGGTLTLRVLDKVVVTAPSGHVVMVGR